MVPDIIMLGINLPDIDGYEVCRRIREIRLARHVPVIFLTKKGEREDKLTGLELDVVDYLTIPFEILELALRVRNWLRRGRLQSLESPADFVIFTAPWETDQLAMNSLIRLGTAVPYYYPDYDHENVGSKLTNERFTARVASLSSAESDAATFEELANALSAYC